MDLWISLLSDLIILVFDIALYMHLTPLKKEDPLHKALMHGSCVLITAAYVFAAYVLHVPYAVASFLCMTIPSFLLFLCLAKYKNSRFLVTFCFVDTVTFIIAACGKFALILGGTIGGILSCAVLLVLSLGVYFSLRPYFLKYRDLMEQVVHGWAPMAVSTVLIYILLIFFAAYPRPLLERLEYVPLYLLLFVAVLSFYWVFIVLILQKAELAQANQLLQQQKRWHDLAYLDELTQLANPASYRARTGDLEGRKADGLSCYILVFDIDDFKNVNDSFGHHYGNQVLKQTADFFLSDFSRKHYEFFRIGGDEFAAIALDLPEQEVKAKVAEINRLEKRPNPGCTYSCGYAPVDFSQEKAFEQAFIQADQAMYVCKTRKKEKK